MLFNPNRVTLTRKRSKKIFFMQEKQTKKIKLQPKHRALAYGQKIVPWLTISGVWLEQNGFKAGDTVTITAEKNQLIIKK